MGMARKQRRALMKKKIAQNSILSEAEYNALYDAIKKDIAEQIVFKTMAIALSIIDTSYGKLKPRETRFEVFVDAYKHELEMINTPTLIQNEYEERLKKVGFSVKWDD